MCLAGHPNASLRIFLGLCGAFSASYDELDVVWEDSQGTEEDISKEAVTDVICMYKLI